MALDALIQEYDKSLETLPTEISADRFMEMLEVLPPCRWQKLGNFEVFHCSEGLTGNLVAWFVQGNGKSYEFMQSKYLKKRGNYKIIGKGAKCLVSEIIF